MSQKKAATGLVISSGDGWVLLQAPKCLLVLNREELVRALRRGKAWKRRHALAQRLATAGGVTGDREEGCGHSFLPVPDRSRAQPVATAAGKNLFGTGGLVQQPQMFSGGFNERIGLFGS